MRMKKVNRRKFIQGGTMGAIGGSALLGCTPEQAKINTPYINFNKTVLWKMVTTWPPNFPVVGEGCNMFAYFVEKMSGGRMKIQVYGGGELIPALECFDAVSNGAIELGHGASYYWAGAAKYYYYPGWHEPGTVLELLVNKPRYQELSSDLQQIIKGAAGRINTWMWLEFEIKNSIYLKKLIDEEGVTPRMFPKEVLDQLRIYTKEVIGELTAQGEKEERIYKAYQKCRNSIDGWAEITEKVMDEFY